MKFRIDKKGTTWGIFINFNNIGFKLMIKILLYANLLHLKGNRTAYWFRLEMSSITEGVIVLSIQQPKQVFTRRLLRFFLFTSINRITHGSKWSLCYRKYIPKTMDINESERNLKKVAFAINDQELNMFLHLSLIHSV